MRWYPYYSDGFKCTLEKDSDGVHLEIEAFGETIEEAFDAAYKKWYRILDKGAPELAAPQIEYQPTITSDDEIPF